MNSIPRASGIYQILCVPTGKVYVGSSIDMARRQAEHVKTLRANRHRNRYLQFAWNKYGERAFLFSVLEVVAPSHLVEREQHYIDVLGACDDKCGYNLAPNASSALGARWTIEARQRFSRRCKGRTLSPEARAKVSAALRGRLPSFRATELTRQRSQKSYIVTLPNGDEQVILNLRDFCRLHNLSYKSAHNVVRGAANQHKSYRFRHIHEEEQRKLLLGYAEEWIVTTPEGVELSIRNLKAFCRDRGISYASMRAVAFGRTKQHKGWKCRLVR